MDYDAIAREYHENGFGVVPGFFSSEELAEVDRQLRRYLQESLSDLEPGEAYYEDGGGGAVRCVFRINQRSGYFAGLMRDSRLIELVEALYPGAAAEADGVMLIDKAPYATYEFPYHQDNAYQFWNPAEAVAVTLALDEANDDNGTIVCLKGSHRAPILPHQPSGVTGASLGLLEKPDLSRYPEVPLDLKPGDLSLHHVNVIHRTGPNRTAEHRRNLGFAYHSSRARRDREAHARYQEHLGRINTSIRQADQGG